MSDDTTQVYLVAGSAPPMPCGVGDYTARLVVRVAMRHSVRVAQLDGTTPLAASAKAVPNWSATGVWATLRDIRASRAHVLSVQYPTAGFSRSMAIHALIPLVRLTVHPRPRIVVTLHEQSASPIVGRLRNSLMTIPSDAVIVSNPSDLRALPRRERRKARIVPIGTNIPVVQMSSAERESLAEQVGLEPGRRTAVFFGHAFRSKRLEDLMGAIRLLPEMQLLIISRLDAGRDPYHAGLLRMVEDVRRDRIGAIRVVADAGDSDVSRLLQLADFFVLPARHPLTAKSGSAIAAALHGLVVIGQAAPNIADSRPFVNGVNALLIEMGTPEQIRQALARVSSSPELAGALASGARELAEAFDWDGIVDRTLRVWAPDGLDPLP